MTLIANPNNESSRGPADRCPRVSIGMPVFNGDNYLALAIESMLDQTFEDFELIISDNASTDDTEFICRTYAQRDARIRYLRETDNRGATWNFNRVFELSRGEYFKWAAHDDLCDPTFLQQCVTGLDNDSTIICCHGKTRKIDSAGNILSGLPDPTEGGVERPHSKRCKARRIPNASTQTAHLRFQDVLLSSGWSARCGGVFRSSAMRKTGMLLPIFGYEKVLMAELALLGRFYDLPQTLFFQRIHAEALTTIDSPDKLRKRFAPLKERSSFFPRLRILRGYLMAIFKFKMSWGERLMCLFWVMAYMFQIRKWKSLFLRTWSGRGNAGNNSEVLEDIRNCESVGGAPVESKRAHV